MAHPNGIAASENGTNGTNGFHTNGTNGATRAKKLWEHATPETTKMTEFKKMVNERFKLDLKSYDDLHKWSIENISDFWREVWDYTGVKASKPYDKVCRSSLSQLLRNYLTKAGRRRWDANVSAPELV